MQCRRSIVLAEVMARVGPPQPVVAVWLSNHLHSLVFTHLVNRAHYANYASSSSVAAENHNYASYKAQWSCNLLVWSTVPAEYSDGCQVRHRLLRNVYLYTLHDIRCYRLVRSAFGCCCAGC